MRTAVLLALLSACVDRTIAELPPQTQGQATKYIPVSTDIDILFVIDDSPSTADKQKVFEKNFTNFVAALDAFPGGRPNMHIGVISTSVDLGSGDWGTGCAHPSPFDGRLQNAAKITGCTPPSGKWIEDVALPDGTRQTNYTGALDSTLACIADLGSSGCGFEAPLQAIEHALDGSHPENAGFLRPGAYLAVIVLTDEDDCSVKDKTLFTLDSTKYRSDDFRCQPMFAYQCDQPISATDAKTYTGCHQRTDSYLETTQHTYDVLSKLKAQGQVVVAVLGGPASTTIKTGAITMPPAPFHQDLALLPSCDATINGNYAFGRPAIRLNDFVTSFGDHGLFRTICQGDYSQTLRDIGDLLFESVSPCLAGDVAADDIDPTTPGLQLDCTVTDVVNLNTSEQHETIIPRCPMKDASTPDTATRPCWWVKSDPAACAAPSSGIELHVERAGAPPVGDNVKVSCAIK